MTRPTEVLIHELATELAPVRRVPRLRTVVALTLALGGATGIAWVAVAGAQLGAHAPELLPYYYAVLAAGGIAALGGICAAGASLVPGRERVQAIGTGVLVGGSAVAAIAALASSASGAARPVIGAHWFESGVGCAALVALLAVPCAALLFHFARRGTPARRALALGLAGASAATLASVAANLTCSTCDLTHAVVFHQIAPALLAASIAAGLIALPAARRG
jgi:hypothetical protein